MLKKILTGIDTKKKYNILDAGSWRTSLLFLTKTFPKSIINAIIYLWDERKASGIRESVTTKNYILQEADIHTFKQKFPYDIVVAHLLLWEATKFSKLSFEKMLGSLFKIKTKYLAIIDILDDPDVDYPILLKYIATKGNIQKIIYEGKYIGFLLSK